MLKLKEVIMPRKNNKKVKMELANGKQEDSKGRSVEEILGVYEKNNFNAKNTAEFESNLKEMSLNQMQEMAVSAGIFPSGTKPMLRNKLVKAFKEYMLNNGRITSPKTTQEDPQSDLAKRFMSIMNTWDK